MINFKQIDAEYSRSVSSLVRNLNQINTEKLNAFWENKWVGVLMVKSNDDAVNDYRYGKFIWGAFNYQTQSDTLIADGELELPNGLRIPVMFTDIFELSPKQKNFLEIKTIVEFSADDGNSTFKSLLNLLETIQVIDIKNENSN